MSSFSVVTNIGALNAHNELIQTERHLKTTINRLSTGLRINGAMDDAAGLAIAENLRADVQGLSQALRNANDGISVINVADSALQEIANLLHRAMTLAEQAASDTSGDTGSTSKQAIDSEYAQILEEIDRIAATVDFNGLNLLSTTDPSGQTTIDIQVGLTSSADDRIQIVTSNISVVDLGLTTGTLTDAPTARTELEAIQNAIDQVSGERGSLGAYYNRIEHTISVITVQSENLAAAESQIRDADIASEVVNLTKYQVLTQTGLSALSQANSSSQNVLSLLGG